MSEGQAEGGPEPQDAVAGPAPGLGRQGMDPAAVLLAVERVGADVAALSRSLASQPEEVAARLDVDAATASIGVRVGALGSTLDQLRLSLLAALDRSAERIDAPAWLPAVQAALAELAPPPEGPHWLPSLHRVEHAVAELADGVRAGAAVGDALEDLGQRLASIEDAAGRVADDARVLVERVAPVPDRLSAIASQIDRITPLARAGDNAGTLFDRLDHVGGSLVEVIAMLRARGGGPADEVEERFEGIVDVLAGVTRRQDQVTAAIASVLDQVRGPKGVDAVLERMEQRERSLAARLDRIDAELRRNRDAGSGSAVEARVKPDGETARAFEVVAAMMEQQERELTVRLDHIEAELQSLREATTTAGADTAGFDRMEQRERSLAARLDRIDAELRRVTQGTPAGSGPVVAPGVPSGDADSGAAGSLAASAESIATVTGGLARLIESTAERLDRRLARLESRLDDAPPGAAAASRPTTSPEAAALRLAELRAERAQVQARLQEERLLAAQIRNEP